MTQTKQPKTASKSSSHTPGPWKVEQIDTGPIVTTPNEWVANVARQRPASQANARLIAAAPEMYEWMKAEVSDLELLASSNSLSAWQLVRLETALRIKAAIDGEG